MDVGGVSSVSMLSVEDGLNEKMDEIALGGKDEVTFVVEGRKISVGSDFLSLHSEYFMVLLKGDAFSDRMRDEIELKDVKYEEFSLMLEYLADPTRAIEAEDVKSLLKLCDFYDIKCLSDRVESFLVNTDSLTTAQKLLMADQNRLIRLQMWCVGWVSGVSSSSNRQSKEDVVNSPEFAQLSETSKNCFMAGTEKQFVYKVNPEMKYNLMNEVKNVEKPANGFIASGILGLQYDMGEFEETRIEFGGLIWHVSWGDETFLKSPYLVVNFDHRSTVDWSVEGFVTAELVVDLGTIQPSTNKVEKKYAFSLNNLERIGKMSDFVSEEKRATFEWYMYKYVKFRIDVTAVSGVRKSPSFDFSAPSNLTDGVFIVEGQKVHVNKQYLSMISNRFKELFYEKNEVKLQNVKYKDFIEFLRWIYPSARRDLDTSTMFGVMRVAQLLEVNIDSSAVSKYLTESHRDILYPERIIFYVQFNLDLGQRGANTTIDLEEDTHYLQLAYERLMECDIFSQMTVDKINAVYKYIIYKDW